MKEAKYLILKSGHRESFRIAQCLVDAVDHEGDRLVAFYDNSFWMKLAGVPGLSKMDNFIIPVQYIKICGHTAAKLQIDVVGEQKGIKVFGKIKKVVMTRSGPRFRIDSDDGMSMMFRSSQIGLNFNTLNETSGCAVTFADDEDEEIL